MANRFQKGLGRAGLAKAPAEILRGAAWLVRGPKNGLGLDG